MKNLIIYQKCYDLYVYIQGPLRQLPKHEKYVLAAQIRNSLLQILRKIILANKTRKKLPILYDIDADIEVLRSLLRLTKEMKYISLIQYGMCAYYIDEIGKMLGGWIKAASQQ